MPHGTTSAASRLAAASSFDSTLAFGSSSTSASAGSISPLDVEAAWGQLVDRAIAAMASSDAKPDPAFGAFAPVVALVRSVAFHEGVLLEWGLTHLCSNNPDLLVMASDCALPIVPAALAIIRRNGWKDLSGIQLSAEVHAKTTYTPDLLIVDRARHAALILDLKRGLHAYSETRLNALRERMMATAMITADWLHVEGKAPPVSQVGIAIIDGSNETSDHGKGIFGLSEIDSLIGVTGAGEAMAQLRALFATRIQAAMEEACRTIVVPTPAPGTASATAMHADLSDPNASDRRTDDGIMDEDDLFPDGAHLHSRFSGAPVIRDRNDRRSAWRRVSVGFARAGPS